MTENMDECLAEKLEKFDELVRSFDELVRLYELNTSKQENGTLYIEEFAEKLILCFPEIVELVKELRNAY